MSQEESATLYLPFRYPGRSFLEHVAEDTNFKELEDATGALFEWEGGSMQLMSMVLDPPVHTAQVQ